MTTKTQARAPVRALIGAAAFGSLVGLAVGCAYLGGSMARTMTVQAKAERLTGVQKVALTDTALITASGVDQSALMIARRHDPYSVAGGAERDRAATLAAERLIDRDGSPVTLAPAAAPDAAAGLRKANFSFVPAAKPFRFGQPMQATRDLDCLTQAVYYEARGEGSAGMQAVAQVVLNRVRHPSFPKSVCGVVFQGAGQGSCQFSFACDGSMDARQEGEAWRRAREVAAKALSGYVMSEVGNATHFHTTAVTPNWRSNLLRIAQVGSHVFYRFGGSAGGPDAFHYTPKPSTPMDTAHPVIAGFAPSLPDGPKSYAMLVKGVEAVGAKLEAPLKAAEPKADAPKAAEPKAEVKAEGSPAG